jgi:hypothetical protein
MVRCIGSRISANSNRLKLRTRMSDLADRNRNRACEVFAAWGMAAWSGLRPRLGQALRLLRETFPLVVLLFAAFSSAALQDLYGWDSNRYVFPILASLSFLWILLRQLEPPHQLMDALQPFPSRNLYCFLVASAFAFYPFSLALRNIGVLPLLIGAALVDAIVYATKNRGLELGTLTAAIGLLIFAWLWELAGRPDRVVLPVDLPEMVNHQFTSEGVTNALLNAIDGFPAQEPSLVSNRDTKQNGDSLPHVTPDISEVSNFSMGRVGRPFFELEQGALLDAPHVIGKAQLGGVNLEPLYHTFSASTT